MLDKLTVATTVTQHHAGENGKIYEFEAKMHLIQTDEENYLSVVPEGEEDVLWCFKVKDIILLLGLHNQLTGWDRLLVKTAKNE